MKYTLKQLEIIYQNLRSSWISFRNDDPEYPYVDVSGKVKNLKTKITGAWVVQASIHSEDMKKALPVLHQAICAPNAPHMAIKIASERILQRDHDSAQQVLFIFDKNEEENNQEKILLFLWELGCALEKAEIREDIKPPLTLHTQKIVAACGSNADKKNEQQNKQYVAQIKMKETEEVSRFYYRANAQFSVKSESFCATWNDLHDEAEIYPQEDINEKDRNKVIKASDFESWDINNSPERKHNPFQQGNDFFYGVILEKVAIGKTALDDKTVYPQATVPKEEPSKEEPSKEEPSKEEPSKEEPSLVDRLNIAKSSLLAEIRLLKKHGEKIRGKKGRETIILARDLKDCVNNFFELKLDEQASQSNNFINDFEKKLMSKNDIMHDPRLSFKTTLINIGIALTVVGAFFVAYQLYTSHKAGRMVGFFANKQTRRDEYIHSIQKTVTKIAKP